MAAIYKAGSGDEIGAGLQGCNVCDAAILAAQRWADELGEDVHLSDDDGEWMVHAKLANGTREPATEMAWVGDELRVA